jgi:hypothetical protein
MATATIIATTAIIIATTIATTPTILATTIATTLTEAGGVVTDPWKKLLGRLNGRLSFLRFSVAILAALARLAILAAIRRASFEHPVLVQARGNAPVRN